MFPESDDNERDFELEEMMIAALEEGNDEDVPAPQAFAQPTTQNQPIPTIFPEPDDNERDFELEEMMIAALEEGNDEDFPAPQAFAQPTIQNQPFFSSPTQSMTTAYGADQPTIPIDPALESLYKPQETTTSQTAPDTEIKPFTDEDLDKLLADIDAQANQGNDPQPQQSQFIPFQPIIPSFGGIQTQSEPAPDNPAPSTFIFSAQPQTQAIKPDTKPHESVPAQLPPPTGDQIFNTPAQVAQRPKAEPRSIASRLTPNISNRPKKQPKSIRGRLEGR
jgi:hypothetical protein